ncbi:MAG: thiamine phosphate synthase [Maricaulaceae bacterium]
MTRCRLYLITPPRIDDLADFARALEAALGAGDVAAVQIRVKEGDAGAAARALTPVIQAGGAAAIVNDDPQLAAKVGADGVHVGQEDASYAAARATVGPKAIVGVTCHASRDLAMTAADAGADYVAFGAFFETATKSPKSRATPEIIEWWSEIFEVPCVAIGGVTAENCAPLVRAGADFLAVSSGVWGHSDGPAAGVVALNNAIGAALRSAESAAS